MQRSREEEGKKLAARQPTRITKRLCIDALCTCIAITNTGTFSFARKHRRRLPSPVTRLVLARSFRKWRRRKGREDRRERKGRVPRTSYWRRASEKVTERQREREREMSRVALTLPRRWSKRSLQNTYYYI